MVEYEAMRLSKKGEYAVRALIEIGFESKARPNSLIQISTVAQRTAVDSMAGRKVRFM